MELKRPEFKSCCAGESKCDGPDRVRQEVVEQYDQYVRESGNAKVGSFAQMAGYDSDEIGSLPEAAVLNSLSCGDPVRFSEMQPGESVLDLGCGAGIDMILAARRVGASGRVIGVDLSAQMLALASSNIQQANLPNAKLFAAQMESLPVESDSMDWIISNCAVNLSPEKDRVVAEMARVLKPGGRILISDIVTDELPEWLRQLSWNFVTCIGLSVGESEYRSLFERHGFGDVTGINRFVYGEKEMHQLLDHEYKEIKNSFSEEDVAQIVAAARDRIVKIDWRAQLENAAEYRVVPFEEKVDQQGYRDLLCYIVSNTIAGEIMGADNYMCMAAATQDFDEKKAFVEDAAHELRHVEMLAGIGKRFGFPVEKRMIEPQWKNVHQRLRSVAEKADIVTCRLIQDIMAESQAVVLYRFLSGFQSEVDAVTSGVARAILRDETEHLEAGIAAIRQSLVTDADRTHDKLIWAHDRVMPEFFALIRYGCDSLCDVLGMECRTLSLDAFKADLDELRVNALDSYVEVLEKCRFDSTIVASLIAGMAAWQETTASNEVRPRLRNAGGRCCG